jgi:mannose-6-phosphate isomerase-like protein (cupin superfamily)
MHLLPNYDSEERPWGTPERFTANETTTVKLLHMKPGKRFSLQRHKHRSEFWRAVRGSGMVTVGEETRPFKEGDEVMVPTGTVHRLEGGPDGLVVLEIIFGEYDENDIERLEDDFGRI